MDREVRTQLGSGSKSVGFLPIKFNRTTSTIGALCVFARVILYPIFSSSRQDAKTAKKNVFLFLRTWRPLRLCGSPCGVLIPTQAEYDPQGVTPRGKSSFIRFPKPKFNGKFQICLFSPPPCDDLRDGPSRPPSGKNCSRVNKPDEPCNVPNN